LPLPVFIPPVQHGVFVLFRRDLREFAEIQPLEGVVGVDRFEYVTDNADAAAVVAADVVSVRGS
jgi:hypothetical protein